jgi:hypothetical protein
VQHVVVADAAEHMFLSTAISATASTASAELGDFRMNLVNIRTPAGAASSDPYLATSNRRLQPVSLAKQMQRMLSAKTRTRSDLGLSRKAEIVQVNFVHITSDCGSSCVGREAWGGLRHLNECLEAVVTTTSSVPDNVIILCGAESVTSVLTMPALGHYNQVDVRWCALPHRLVPSLLITFLRPSPSRAHARTSLPRPLGDPFASVTSITVGRVRSQDEYLKGLTAQLIANKAEFGCQRETMAKDRLIAKAWTSASDSALGMAFDEDAGRASLDAQLAGAKEVANIENLRVEGARSTVVGVNRDASPLWTSHVFRIRTSFRQLVSLLERYTPLVPPTETTPGALSKNMLTYGDKERPTPSPKVVHALSGAQTLLVGECKVNFEELQPAPGDSLIGAKRKVGTGVFGRLRPGQRYHALLNIDGFAPSVFVALAALESKKPVSRIFQEMAKQELKVAKSLIGLASGRSICFQAYARRVVDAEQNLKFMQQIGRSPWCLLQAGCLSENGSSIMAARLRGVKQADLAVFGGAGAAARKVAVFCDDLSKCDWTQGSIPLASSSVALLRHFPSDIQHESETLMEASRPLVHDSAGFLREDPPRLPSGINPTLLKNCVFTGGLVTVAITGWRTAEGNFICDLSRCDPAGQRRQTRWRGSLRITSRVEWLKKLRKEISNVAVDSKARAYLKELHEVVTKSDDDTMGESENDRLSLEEAVISPLLLNVSAMQLTRAEKALLEKAVAYTEKWFPESIYYGPATDLLADDHHLKHVLGLEQNADRLRATVSRTRNTRSAPLEIVAARGMGAGATFCVKSVGATPWDLSKYAIFAPRAWAGVVGDDLKVAGDPDIVRATVRRFRKVLEEVAGASGITKLSDEQLELELSTLPSVDGGEMLQFERKVMPIRREFQFRNEIDAFAIIPTRSILRALSPFIWCKAAEKTVVTDAEAFHGAIITLAGLYSHEAWVESLAKKCIKAFRLLGDLDHQLEWHKRYLDFLGKDEDPTQAATAFCGPVAATGSVLSWAVERDGSNDALRRGFPDSALREIEVTTLAAVKDHVKKIAAGFCDHQKMPEYRKQSFLFFLNLRMQSV